LNVGITHVMPYMDWDSWPK